VKAILHFELLQRTAPLWVRKYTRPFSHEVDLCQLWSDAMQEKERLVYGVEWAKGDWPASLRSLAIPSVA